MCRLPERHPVRKADTPTVNFPVRENGLAKGMSICPSPTRPRGRAGLLAGASGWDKSSPREQPGSNRPSAAQDPEASTAPEFFPSADQKSYFPLSLTPRDRVKSSVCGFMSGRVVQSSSLSAESDVVGNHGAVVHWLYPAVLAS